MPIYEYECRGCGDQFELLVLKDTGRRHVSIRADRARWRVFGEPRILHKAQRLRVDAQFVRRGLLQKRLGIDRAGEVHMQISALGHLREERFEGEHVGLGCLCRLERSHRPLLARRSFLRKQYGRHQCQR